MKTPRINHPSRGAPRGAATAMVAWWARMELWNCWELATGYRPLATAVSFSFAPTDGIRVREEYKLNKAFCKMYYVKIHPYRCPFELHISIFTWSDFSTAGIISVSKQHIIKSFRSISNIFQCSCR